MYDPCVLSQVPPFIHGLFRHSLTSAKQITKKGIQHFTNIILFYNYWIKLLSVIIILMQSVVRTWNRESDHTPILLMKDIALFKKNTPKNTCVTYLSQHIKGWMDKQIYKQQRSEKLKLGFQKLKSCKYKISFTWGDMSNFIHWDIIHPNLYTKVHTIKNCYTLSGRKCNSVSHLVPPYLCTILRPLQLIQTNNKIILLRTLLDHIETKRISQ